MRGNVDANHSLSDNIGLTMYGGLVHAENRAFATFGARNPAAAEPLGAILMEPIECWQVVGNLVGRLTPTPTDWRARRHSTTRSNPPKRRADALSSLRWTSKSGVA